MINGRVIAVVKDLFFVARIRETARLAGASVVFARSAVELASALAEGGRLVLLDLTGGLDYQTLFRTLDEVPADRRPPVLAFTTHALAARTKPWHARCERVVTKETLTEELPLLLRQGAAAG